MACGRKGRCASRASAIGRVANAPSKTLEFREIPRPFRRDESTCGRLQPGPRCVYLALALRTWHGSAVGGAPMKSVRDTHLLGAELELVAPYDLEPLLAHIRSSVGIVRNSVDEGVHTLWLELVPTEKTLDEAMHRYVALVQGLPPALRDLWDRAIARCVNVGVDVGLGPHAFHVNASNAALAQAARVDMGLVVTVYAPDLNGR